MIFLPAFATLYLSAMLAVSAAPSLHVEIDIPASYLGDSALTTRVGGIHLHATHDEHPGRVSNGTALASSNMDPTFEGCKPWDEVAIRNAIGDARELVTDALKSLDTKRMDARYQRWFGKPDETRYKVALYRFGIVNDYHLEDWTYKCHDPCLETSESASVSAYVDNDIFGVVHICPDWLRELDANERARVLIHEATHFKYDAVLGTKDFGYTVEECMGLARDEPNDAVWNAANYEHFSDDRKGGLWEAEALAYGNDESDARGMEVTAQEMLAA